MPELKKDFSKCNGCTACVEYIVSGENEKAVAVCANGALRIEDIEEGSFTKGEK